MPLLGNRLGQCKLDPGNRVQGYCDRCLNTKRPSKQSTSKYRQALTTQCATYNQAQLPKKSQKTENKKVKEREIPSIPIPPYLPL